MRLLPIRDLFSPSPSLVTSHADCTLGQGTSWPAEEVPSLQGERMPGASPSSQRASCPEGKETQLSDGRRDTRRRERRRSRPGSGPREDARSDPAAHSEEDAGGNLSHQAACTPRRAQALARRRPLSSRAHPDADTRSPPAPALLATRGPGPGRVAPSSPWAEGAVD